MAKMYWAYKNGKIPPDWCDTRLRKACSSVKYENITFEEYALKMFPSAANDNKRFANYKLEGNFISYVMQRYLVIIPYRTEETTNKAFIHHPEIGHSVYLKLKVWMYSYF